MTWILMSKFAIWLASFLSLKVIQYNILTIFSYNTTFFWLYLQIIICLKRLLWACNDGILADLCIILMGIITLFINQIF